MACSDGNPNAYCVDVTIGGVTTCRHPMPPLPPKDWPLCPKKKQKIPNPIPKLGLGRLVVIGLGLWVAYEVLSRE